MKITYLRLKGYVNILNGMGMDEIVIPFSNFKNRIILISGQNGTGKSSLIRAMTPDPDPNECFRTDVLVDPISKIQKIIEYPAEKEIRYFDSTDNSEYRILIQSLVDSSRTKRTNKCYISKNGEEYNPTGNVNLFKETRDALMGIDSVYLGMSAVSSENRGLVDMIPSERRKYLASYIGSLDTYNEIFKNLSKKVSNCKSYMNTINAKIHEIGNENELRLTLAQLENTLKAKNRRRDELIKELADAEAVIRILDPNNETQALCESISGNLRIIKDEMEKNQRKLDSLSTKTGITVQIADCDKMIDRSNKRIEDNTNLCNKYKNKINTLIALNSSLEERLNSDIARLNSLSSGTIQSNIETVVDELKIEIDYFKTIIGEDRIVLLESLNLEDLSSLRNTLNKFLESISIIEDEVDSEDMFIEVLSHVYNDEDEYKQYISSLDDKRVELTSDIASIKSEIGIVSKNIESIKSFDSKRPSGCKFNDCPFISDFMILKNSSNTEEHLNKLIQKQNDLIKELDTINTQKINGNKIIDLIDRLHKSIDTLRQNERLILVIKDISFILSINTLKDKLSNHYRFPEFDAVTKLIEDYTYYNDYKKASDQMKSLEGDLKVYQNNKEIINSLTESIEKAEKERDSRNDEIKKLQKDISFTDQLTSQITSNLEVYKEYKSELEISEKLAADKQNLKDQFEAAKEKIKTVSEKSESISNIEASIDSIDNEIKPISESINKINYSLTNIVSYQQEYATYSEKFEKLSFIRNACSPGNGMGIQSEFVKHYMNEIILTCNKILGYMFSGTIQLDIPVINEKQFSIPFIGPGGLTVPDISGGSTAQKCMIGLVLSCVSMMKASNKYNIPRFDEIDGGLDQQNRIMFIQIMNQVLDIMESEQCIICSHNTEFDTQNVSKIFCSISGPEYSY